MVGGLEFNTLGDIFKTFSTGESHFGESNYIGDALFPNLNKIDGTATQPQNIIDFSTMSAAELSKLMQQDPDLYEKYPALFDYWLEEKSYDRRYANTTLAAQFKQLKDLGINPMLAMSLLSGTNSALSGGASSSSASYMSSRLNNEATTSTSRANNITSALRASLIPIVLAVLAAML